MKEATTPLTRAAIHSVIQTTANGSTSSPSLGYDASVSQASLS